MRGAKEYERRKGRSRDQTGTDRGGSGDAFIDDDPSLEKQETKPKMPCVDVRNKSPNFKNQKNKKRRSRKKCSFQRSINNTLCKYKVHNHNNSGPSHTQTPPSVAQHQIGDPLERKQRKGEDTHRRHNTVYFLSCTVKARPRVSLPLAAKICSVHPLPKDRADDKGPGPT